MKRICILSLLMIVVLSFSAVPVSASNITSNNEIPDEVLQVAERGVSMYKNIVKSDLSKWGLATEEEVDQAAYYEGFEVVFLKGEITSVPSNISLLDLQRDVKYPEWTIVIGINGEPKTYLTVAKLDGVNFEVAEIGGNAEYFAHAREAFRNFAGDSVKPVLLSFAMEKFLMTTKDGQEYIIPVPNNEESDAKVVSGNGVISSTQLIAAIQKNYQEYQELLEKYPDPKTMPMGGVSFNVWDANPDDMKVDNGTTSLIIISIISVIAAAIISIMLISLRNKKVMQQ